MTQGKNSQRKRVVILDRNLDLFTKEEIAKDLVGKIQEEFPERFVILPVASKKHLEAVCKNPEQNILFIYGRDDSNEFTQAQISYMFDASIYVSSLKTAPIDSIKNYVEKIAEIIRKYKI